MLASNMDWKIIPQNWVIPETWLSIYMCSFYVILHTWFLFWHRMLSPSNSQHQYYYIFCPWIQKNLHVPLFLGGGRVQNVFYWLFNFLFLIHTYFVHMFLQCTHSPHLWAAHFHTTSVITRNLYAWTCVHRRVQPIAAPRGALFVGLIGRPMDGGKYCAEFFQKLQRMLLDAVSNM